MRTQSCPGPEELRSFVRCDVSETKAELINAHLQACQDCEATVVQLEREGDTVAERLRRTASQPTYATEPECQALLQTLADEATLAPTLPSGVQRAAPGEASRDSGSTSAPDRLRDYRLLEKLGEGGMGAVYRAQHQRLKRTVAVKILPANRLTDPITVARFEREMEVLGQLNHPHIVQALDAGEHDGQHYLVMEFVDGLDLAALVKARGPLSIPDACQAIREAALGLQYAHEHGYVHRDIKPSNLMIAKTSSGPSTAHVKVLDLGLARALDHAPTATAGGELTSTSQVMGTLDYMAPEQGGDAHQVDIRADIYSLGASLYKLLTGVSPFAEHSHKPPLQRLMAMAASEPASVLVKRREIPPELAAIVHRMLAKRADERFATPAEVVAALEPFCAGADLGALLGVASSRKRESLSAATQVAMRTTHPSSKLPRTRVALAWGGAALVALAVILALTTRHGAVTVEAPSGQLPDDLQVVVSQGGQEVTVLQADNQWTAKVVQGEYQVQVRGGDDQFQIVNSKLRVTRLGKVVVELDIKKPGAAVAVSNAAPNVPPAGADRGKGPPSSPTGTSETAKVTPVRQADASADRPFVLIRENQVVRQFRSLVGAIADQQPGDWIEVRSNGSLEAELPPTFPTTLAIRGGAGFHPHLLFRGSSPGSTLSPNTSWRFERCDLDLRRLQFQVFHGAGAYELELRGCGIWGGSLIGWTKVKATDCVFAATNGMFATANTEQSEVILENCAIHNRLVFFNAQRGRHSLVLRHCTYFDVDGYAPHMITVDEGAGLAVEATRCVFHRDAQGPHLIEPKSLARVTWTGVESCFSGTFWVIGEVQPDGAWKTLDKGLSAWRKQLQGTERDSIEVDRLAFEWGRVQRQTDRRVDAIAAAIRDLTANQEPIEAGPNWDLVGAGDAYVRALAAAGRPVAEADLRPEQVAGGPVTLVVDGGKPRGFQTLDAAFAEAPSGAVVELRSDGPFPLTSISGKSRRLTLRSAPGYRPVIDGLQFTEGALVELEGIVLKEVLQVFDPDVAGGNATPSPQRTKLLRAMNCETLSPTSGVNAHFASQPGAELVNCFLHFSELQLDAEATAALRNSVLANFAVSTLGKDAKPATLAIDRCALFCPEQPIQWVLTSVGCRTPTRIASQRSIYVPPRSLIGTTDFAATWSGDHNVFVMDSTYPLGGAPLDLPELRQLTKSDQHSRELRPWQLRPQPWKILGEESPGYKPLADGDYGVDVARLTAAFARAGDPR